MKKLYEQNVKLKVYSLFLFLFSALIFFIPYKNYAQSNNVKLIGRWAKGPCYAAAIDVSIGYFGNGSYLEIVDFSNPSQPVELGKIVLPSVVHGVAISENYTYVEDWSEGLRIIDISNPSSPTEAGFFNTAGSAYGVAVSGNYAYVADDDDGLRIIDISTPSSPTEAGFFDTGGSAFSVAVNGNYAYVADGADGLYILQNDLLTDIYGDKSDIPMDYHLSQNYPNPFNPETKISYRIANSCHVTLMVYDLLGSKIKTLVDSYQKAGDYDVYFNAMNLASGVYIYKIKTDKGFTAAKKLILLK
jgi:hypothetical protein